jgi:alpha-L-arabinofuranosidase
MKKIVFIYLLLIGYNIVLFSQLNRITIDTKDFGARVSKDLHGVFFEEINHGGEGGLYAELIQNRGFEECRIPPGCKVDSGFLIPPRTPHYNMPSQVSDWKMDWKPELDHPAWYLQTSEKTNASIKVVTEKPLNDATPHSLQIDIQEYKPDDKINLVNSGFWGISVKKGEKYDLSFYLHNNQLFKGTILVSLQTKKGKILASHKFCKVNAPDWKKFQCKLTANESDTSAVFCISFGSKGTVWIDFVSLFPEKTFKNRPNGLREDLAQYIADLHPAFVRWPGGCYVEGISLASAPDWKRTIGLVEQRSGTYSVWGYWSSDGLGYHEYLQFCEDIGAKALYVFNCGVSCGMRSGTFVPDDSIQPYVDNALDAIEYAIGPVSSKWGSVRAKNGHPKPFPLKYVEVGNEQWGEQYGRRFNVFYKAIKEKYPEIEVMASMGLAHIDNRILKAIRKTDFVDEHTYKSIYWPMIYNDWYDKYDQRDRKIYIGEYACNGGVGRGNMMAALNDAISIMMFERNSDIIHMSSYAPLLENVNKREWDVNLIHFNASQSFARISYYAIKMMNENKADVNLKTIVDIPDMPQQPLFDGKIGLSTWDTYSEFKNISVEQNGKTIYQSDFINRPAEWKTEGGCWQIKDSTLAQTIDGAWPMAILDKLLSDNYILKLKARRTGGTNAFMIPIAIKDNKNYLRAHIGAWVNAVAAFELVSDGTDAMVTQPVRLEKPIENNRWYDVEIRVDKTKVECYLDGKLLIVYKNPRKFFSIAGKDEKTKEIILKVVNANPFPSKTNIDLKGATVYAEGKVICLSSENKDDENSFATPLKYVPQSSLYLGFSSNFDYTFQPMSVTILRMKEKE